MAMSNIQDEIREIPEDDPVLDRRLLAGLLALAVLAGVVLVAVFLFTTGDTDEGWINVPADDGLAVNEGGGADNPTLLGDADLAIVVSESFALDNGEVSAELEALVAEVSSTAGVLDVRYEGPSLITGIAPDSPTLTAYGHRVLVSVDGDLAEVKSNLLTAYGQDPVVEALVGGT